MSFRLSGPVKLQACHFLFLFLLLLFLKYFEGSEKSYFTSYIILKHGKIFGGSNFVHAILLAHLGPNFNVINILNLDAPRSDLQPKFVP